MTACITCPSKGPDDPGHDPDYERRYLCCRRSWGRMAAALHQIPGLLGEVELERGTGSAPKVSGSREAKIPPRIDAVDLTMRARPGSLAVHIGPHGQDQVGHLAVATELEFWATDWADIRREQRPMPRVPELCEWLLNRLDWACQHHYALDEFAGAIGRIFRTLTGVNGLFQPPPETLSAPCPDCHMLGLYRDADIERVACGNCARLLTDEDYAAYAARLIEENTP